MYLNAKKINFSANPGLTSPSDLGNKEIGIIQGKFSSLPPISVFLGYGFVLDFLYE